MAKVRDLMEKVGVFEIFTENVAALQSEIIKDALMQKLEEFGFDGVEVSEVEVHEDGNIIVEFEDFEGDEMTVLFGIDEVEGSYALIVTDDMEDELFDFEDKDVLEVDLSPLSPLEVDTPLGKYINLVDLSWMNKSTLSALLSVGDIDAEIEGGDEQEDPMGDEEGEEEAGDEEVGDEEDVGELFKVVVRGLKKIKLPLIRKKRRKILTSKQRAGLKRAVIARKRVASKSARKRQKSLKLRKSLGVKRTGTPKGYKVSST